MTDSAGNRNLRDGRDTAGNRKPADKTQDGNHPADSLGSAQDLSGQNLRKITSLLGFAQRSGSVASGETAAEIALKKEKAYLLILSADASANTVRKFSGIAATHRVPVLRIFDKQALGQILGKGERSSAAVTDAHFAKEILKQAGQTS